MKTTDLVRVESPELHSCDKTAELVRAFLSGRSPKTIQAYRQDLEDFRLFTGTRDVDEAVRLLLGHGPGEANAITLSYRTHLMGRGLAPATINRRLAALRSMVKLAKTLGVVSFSLEVENVRAEAYRDTRGPGRSGVAGLFDLLKKRQDAKGRRDLAIIRLLYDLGLRRGEVVALDMEDVDLEVGTVAVMGKGHTQKKPLTLPEPTKAALQAWLEVRGKAPGPLFTNFDRAGRGRRLTGTGLYKLVKVLGRKIGLEVRPHGLRHAAITEALNLTKGDVRAVQRFSRHSNLQTLTVYDDNREDLGGEVAQMVAGTV